MFGRYWDASLNSWTECASKAEADARRAGGARFYGEIPGREPARNSVASSNKPVPVASKQDAKDEAKADAKDAKAESKSK